jgi:hypothetical protein
MPVALGRVVLGAQLSVFETGDVEAELRQSPWAAAILKMACRSECGGHTGVVTKALGVMCFGGWGERTYARVSTRVAREKALE